MTAYVHSNKTGYSSNIDTNNTILSNANVVYPEEEQLRIVSTSEDDSLLGQGIQKVKITYLDSNWNINTEIVDMDGTDSVDTVATNIMRIEEFRAYSAGSPIGGAVGTITLKSTDESKLFAQIDPGKNIFERALHFIRPGCITTIKDVTLSCITQDGVKFSLVEFENNENTSIAIPRLTVILSNNAQHISLQCICDASSLTEPMAIGIVVKGFDANQIAAGAFGYQEFNTKSV